MSNKPPFRCLFPASRATLITAGILSGCVTVGMAAPKQAPPVPGSIVAHWTFDADKTDGTKVEDSGPHGYHGTIHNKNATTPAPAPGIHGDGLNFPSGHQSWVEIDSRLNLQPPFTIAAWVRLSARRASMELVGQKAHTMKEGFRINFSTRQFFFEYSDGAENVIVRYDPHQTNMDQWAFVAVTHNGKEISLYVDGEEVQRAAARRTQWSRKPLLLGNYVNQKNEYNFLGTMDEVIILDRALTGAEITKLGQWLMERE